jgi:hypothetical protein
MAQDTNDFTFISPQWVQHNPSDASALIKLLVIHHGGHFEFNSEHETVASTIPMIITEDAQQGIKTVRTLREHMRQGGEDHDGKTETDTEGSQGAS